MHIGIDVNVLGRETIPAGIYTYTWNVVDWLCRQARAHRVTLFLYGEPWMDDPDRLRQLRDSFPRAELQHWFDGFSPRLLSGLRGMPGRVRYIDRRVLLPLWQKLVVPGSPLVSWLWRRTSPSATVDLFHHPAGLSFPLHERANVITLPDLTIRHFPECHTPYTVEWFEGLYRTIGDVDVILTYSEHTKQDLIETMGVAEERIHVTPLAAHERYRPDPDRDRVRAVLARYDLGQRPYLLNVGTLEPRKNHCRLLEAFRRLRQQRPSLEHQLVLVGGQGWKYEPIFEAIESYGLKPHVKWIGFVPLQDLPALYNGADVFVYPSLYEGFGLPPLEAMACGTPVVAARSSSLPEVVGDAGLLVDPLNVDELADAVGQVLADGQLHKTLREKGLQRAGLFSWEKTGRLTLAAYEEARQGRHRRSRGGGQNGNQQREREAILQSMMQRASAGLGD